MNKWNKWIWINKYIVRRVEKSEWKDINKSKQIK